MTNDVVTQKCPSCGGHLDRREGPTGVSYQCLDYDCFQTFTPDGLAFARHRIAATTPHAADASRRPFCETCGKDVAEVLCPVCAKWCADNPPPGDQPMNTGDISELIEQLRLRVADRRSSRGNNGHWYTPIRDDEFTSLIEDRDGLLRELAGLPCSTKGAEDLESGCCGPCRARAALAPYEEGGEPPSSVSPPYSPNSSGE